MTVHASRHGEAQAGRPASAGPSRGARSPSHTVKNNPGVGQASWLSSVINLVNTIVGAGVLAMPLAMAHMGLLLGILFIIWAGITAAFGLYLQTRCARYVERGHSSFAALSLMTYPKASIIFDAAIAIKCFGVGVSYLIIIGDLMPGVVQGFSDGKDVETFLLDRHFWITAFMLIVIPFSFLRRLDSLKYTSVIALISIGYLVVLVVYHYGSGESLEQKGAVHYFQWQGPSQLLASLPVMVFAYTCHQNMFSILNEMKDNSPMKTTSVVTASAGTAGSIYLLVAITGYLTFGDAIEDNIVGMYLPSVASTIGKAAIVVLVMFSYPLQVHPCRASIDAVTKWRPNQGQNRLADAHQQHRSLPMLGPTRSGKTGREETMGETRFAMITTAVVILSYITAMSVSSLAKVLAYVGSTGSTSISFILPGLFYYKISAADSPHYQRLLKTDDDEEESDVGTGLDGNEDASLGRPQSTKAWRRQLLRKLSLALAIYGLLIMIVCLGTNTWVNATH